MDSIPCFSSSSMVLNHYISNKIKSVLTAQLDLKGFRSTGVSGKAIRDTSSALNRSPIPVLM